jgi:spore coat polysaccharide biosynthesis predicted glycosyltransferase SpsG
MLNKVFIRADGSSEIGLGHLIRCNALALMLKNEFQIIFACKEIPIEIFTKISNNGFHIQSIDSEDDFFKILSKDEIVVIDHYGLDTNYQKKIKELGCKLVCIDDLHDKEFFADVIINHAEGILAKDYSCKPYTKLFLGIKYALLRHPFLLASEEENRIISVIKKHNELNDERVGEILIACVIVKLLNMKPKKFFEYETNQVINPFTFFKFKRV